MKIVKNNFFEKLCYFRVKHDISLKYILFIETIIIINSNK